MKKTKHQCAGMETRPKCITCCPQQAGTSWLSNVRQALDPLDLISSLHDGRWPDKMIPKAHAPQRCIPVITGGVWDNLIF